LKSISVSQSDSNGIVLDEMPILEIGVCVLLVFFRKKILLRNERSRKGKGKELSMNVVSGQV
jgi:hypothetical protein